MPSYNEWLKALSQTPKPEPAPQPQHGPQDPVDDGWCEYGRGHMGKRVRAIPRFGQRLCEDHLGALVREVTRRGTWGR